MMAMYDTIELYEFKIHNYPAKESYNGPNRFKSIEFKEDSCGKLSFTDTYESTHINELYSCDSLSDSYDESINIPELKFKDNKEHIILTMYHNIYLKKNPKSTTSEKNITYSDIICDNINIRCKNLYQIYNEKYKINQNIGESYIYMYNSNKNFVIFGDIHGGFHTFFRCLLRLYKKGIILNMLTLEIHQDYCIIFLGNIIGKGVYGLEILYIITKMLDKDVENYKNNNPHVIYNRGNYDDKDIKNVFGITMPLFSSDNIKTHCNDFKVIRNNIKNFIHSLPCAIVLNKKYWLCHGGFPDGIYTEKDTMMIFNDNNFKKNGMENMNKFNKVVEELKNIMDSIKSNDSQYIKINFETAIDIMWSDFTYKSGNNSNFAKHDSRLYGPDIVSKFLELSGLKFIIRGHRDYFANSWLLCTEHCNNFLNEDIHIIDLSKIKTSKSFIHYGEVNENNTNAINSHLKDKNMENYYARIFPDKIFENKDRLGIYPVLTISTNTVNESIITRDSFIILNTKTDLTPKKPTKPKFTSMVNITETTKTTVLNLICKYIST
jgi:hypothetical protein